MDISVSSNFERFLFDLWDRNAATTSEKFEELATFKRFSVSPTELAASRAQFLSFSINTTRTLDAIRGTFASHQYLLCPHSAVGFCAAQDYCAHETFGGEDVVVLGTAHIGKFAESIIGSLGGSDDDAFREALFGCMPTELRLLEQQGEIGEQRRFEVENSLEDVKAYMRQHMGRSA
jgi:threonine synthase